MKSALFEFCEDNSCEVGSSNWIFNEDETGFNNKVWISNKQVLVDWPLLTKDYSKWAKKVESLHLIAHVRPKHMLHGF